MSDEIPFDRSFATHPGAIEEVMPDVRRVVADNGGPFTFTGTNTFIVGRGEVALIDPGPPDDAHRAALETALAGERIAAIIVTHTHRDHSPLARPMAAAHGAPVYGFGPHATARARRPGEETPLDAADDTDFVPDVTLGDGDAVEGPGWRLEALHTPGHTANHICLALADTGVLFSGDHVMAWSTTIVAPPNGSMADYMASLETLRGRDDAIYLPGHGGPVRDPQRFVRALIGHRRQREAAILQRLAAGDRTIGELVTAIYRGLDPRLRGAAGLSVLAHLEDLVARGRVIASQPPTLGAEYRPA
jgi:glyoxylase-like metal-dependent hydrolase (beta-lactamase superfamily II)